MNGFQTKLVTNKNFKRKHCISSKVQCIGHYIAGVEDALIP
jgi:hypothetical protein